MGRVLLHWFHRPGYFPDARYEANLPVQGYCACGRHPVNVFTADHRYISDPVGARMHRRLLPMVPPENSSYKGRGGPSVPEAPSYMQPTTTIPKVRRNEHMPRTSVATDSVPDALKSSSGAGTPVPAF
ncbi:hypothetical protein K458DRAFT_400700 [Lentithecium fluviatile CBS 122367]|uniref:Uncharacterized protein n=1 Tax=Lentithecium fluviatile CBS 122367 TaxID=1168545 RepID=A0A6G1JD85_9PLEO|nr:hypothetical protein K458DRAFT_400700 [Lentithecium fluviatile CBS 122367]